MASVQAGGVTVFTAIGRVRERQHDLHPDAQPAPLPAAPSRRRAPIPRGIPPAHCPLTADLGHALRDGVGNRHRRTTAGARSPSDSTTSPAVASICLPDLSHGAARR